MPAPRNPCPDTFRLSSPWREIRRSPVICSLPSLIPIPTLPCSTLSGLLDSYLGFPLRWRTVQILPPQPTVFPVRENQPQKLDATTEYRSVSTRNRFFFPRRPIFGSAERETFAA